VSKAFTKESDDAPEEPLEVDDAALPPGVKNYVTPAGLESLRAAIEALRVAPEGRERARRLAALERRLAAAEVVDPVAQTADRVLFGATVTLRGDGGRVRRYRIVGVDEADARRGWISWRSPIARALLDLRLGDEATLRTGAGEEELTVESISYG
jgi:transcription elongation factor GreB